MDHGIDILWIYYSLVQSFFFWRSGSISSKSVAKAGVLFLSIFVVASYAIMCNIKYGMNLRYANMWDMPLRFLAVSHGGAIVAGYWSVLRSGDVDRDELGLCRRIAAIPYSFRSLPPL